MRTTVPVRKPNPQDFFRVHPDPEYRLNVALIDLKEERESYLVRPEVYPDLIGEVVHATPFTAVNRQGVIFLRPVRFPPADGRRNEWITTQREAAELAIRKRVRMKANMDRLRGVRRRKRDRRSGVARRAVSGAASHRLPIR